MNTLEAFDEIKAYVSHALGAPDTYPTARTYTSTLGYLQPLLDQVESALKRLAEQEDVKRLCEGVSSKPFYRRYSDGSVEEVDYTWDMEFRVMYDALNDRIAVFTCWGDSCKDDQDSYDRDLYDTLPLAGYGKTWALTKEELQCAERQ